MALTLKRLGSGVNLTPLCGFLKSVSSKEFSFHDHSRIKGLQGKGEGMSLTPYCHFHPLHRHLDIRQAITAESSPLHIGSGQTRTGNLRFLSTSY